MPPLGNLKAAIARGVGRSFRFPGHGGGGYGGGWPGLFGGPWGLLPGTRYDYAREAGVTWLNGIAMTALGWICGAWSEAKVVVHRPRPGDKPEVLTEHPALSLLANPNPDYDDTVLTGGLLLSMLTGNGNGYLFKSRAGATNVVGLYYIPHFALAPLWPISGKDFIAGYRYRTDGVVIDYPESEIVHLRNPRWPMDPANPRMAIHPLAGELRSICNDNEERNFSASVLRNMGIPGAFISPRETGTGFTPEQQTALKRLWKDQFTGDNRGEPLAATIPIDVSLLGFSPEQLATDKLARLNISRICAAIGIDPLVLGLPSDSKTYANLGEARKGAYENLLIPLQKAFDSQLTMQLMPDILGARPGDMFARDYSEVGCLQEAVKDRYERLHKAVGGPFVTRDEARQQLGLPPIEGGDELYEPRGGNGFDVPGAEERPALPRAASLPAAALKKEIGEKWRLRAQVGERERKALPAGTTGA